MGRPFGAAINTRDGLSTVFNSNGELVLSKRLNPDGVENGKESSRLYQAADSCR